MPRPPDHCCLPPPLPAFRCPSSSPSAALQGHSNITFLQGSYEDRQAVHLVMDLCSGGELFDKIVDKGNYSEKDAAALIRDIVRVVAHCHSMGVIHRRVQMWGRVRVGGRRSHVPVAKPVKIAPPLSPACTTSPAASPVASCSRKPGSQPTNHSPPCPVLADSAGT